MRVRLATSAYTFEFEGSPALWNQFFRPILGGIEAPPDPLPVASPQSFGAGAAAQPAPYMGPTLFDSQPGPGTPTARTYYPPREDRREFPRGGPGGGERAPRADRGVWRRRRGGPEPTILVEPTGEAKELYARLSALESRRAEKEAVFAAVYFLKGTDQDVTPEQIAKHLAECGGPPDARIKPMLGKHISRTKLLQAGSAHGSVRLSPKGRSEIKRLIGG